MYNILKIKLKKRFINKVYYNNNQDGEYQYHDDQDQDQDQGSNRQK
jgi:hypothetical protein